MSGETVNSETMRFAVDAWDPDYGTSTRDDQLREATRPVDATVERAPDDWAPVDPDPTTDVPEVITFVDGVRRIDARIWIHNDPVQNGPVQDTAGLDAPGVCASVAAGAVRCSPGRATIEAVEVRRALHTAATGASSIDIGSADLGRAGEYRLRESATGTDEALYLSVHNHMTELESEMADLLDEPGPVVFDGPLGTRDGADAAGYIKSQHVQYLAPELAAVIGRLEPGQRTPIFHIGGELANWSWYLRLPGPRSHSTSGVVRVELPGLGDSSCAVARADRITAALPRFASEPHKDSRAPQNLYPIAGLERELRRRLGDAMLLDRALRKRSAFNRGSPAPV